MFLAGAIGCRNANPFARNDTVAIGFAYPFDSLGVVSELRGMRMAVDAYNAARPAARPPLTIRIVPRGITRSGVSATLRDDRSVIGAVGFSQTDPTLAAVDVFADAEHDHANALVLISPTATGTQLSGVSPWFFRLSPTDSAMVERAAAFVGERTRTKQVALVYIASDYGKYWHQQLPKRLAAMQIRVDVQLPYDREDLFDTSTTVWGQYAARIARSRADIVVMPGPFYWRELRVALTKEGVHPVILASDALFGNPRVVVADLYAVGTDALRGTPAVLQFQRDYTGRFGVAPPVTAVLGHDAAALIAEALAHVGTSRSRIREWIALRNSPARAFMGVAGPTYFNADHDAVTAPVAVKQITSDARAPLLTARPSSK